MGDPVYGVESFHFNVQAGDSAAHLLVQLSGKNPDDGAPVGEKPYVLSAVLIDGGDNAHETPDAVYKSIRELHMKYDFHNADAHNPKGLTKFDAVIVTHWDKDHYEGLANVLARDVRETVGANGHIAAGDIRISFFKYGDGTGRSRPVTTVYAPVWKATGPPRSKKTTRGAPASRWDKTADGEGEYLGVAFRGTEKPRDDIGGLGRIARLDYQDLLGMDFFRKKKLGSVAGLTSPQKLLDRHGTAQWPGAPGMYCLGAAAATMPTAGMSASGVRVVNVHDSPTNASSISCAVIWPGAPPRVAHYFAGDAEYETEESIVDWVGKTKVRSVKASHHGSATSFPVRMLKDWQPDHIVVSAGSMHGHPRWELLVYLFYHSLLRSITSFGRNYARLLPTCYPYWFGKDRSSPPQYVIPIQRRKGREFSRISTDAFEADSQADADYREALGELITRLKKHLAFFFGTVNALEDYQAQPDDWRVRVRFLSQICCERMWRFLSPVPPEYYPTSKHSGACVFSGPSMMARIAQKRVAYVLVQSRARADDETAGSYAEGDHLIGLSSQGVVLSGVKTLASWTTFLLPARFKPGGPTAADKVAVPFNVQEDGVLFEDLDDEDEDEPSTGWKPAARADGEAASRPGLDKRRALLAARADEPAPPPVPTAGYFYCSTRTAQPRAATLTGLLDGFVSRLHTAWLGVAGAPTRPDEDVAVLNTDELYMWFDEVFGLRSFGTRRGAFTVQGSASTITEASLGLTFAGCQLQLSSSATPWVFGLPHAAPPTIPPPAGAGPVAPVLYADDVLILGLSSTAGSVSPSLQAVCDDLQLPVPAFLADVASGVTLELTPATEQGHRNALWFAPDTDYRATLRLVFAIQGIDSSKGKDPLNSRLFAALGLVVHSAKVIVRKSATFTIAGAADDTSNAAIAREAGLAFSAKVAIRTGGKANDPEPTIETTLVCNLADGSLRVVVQCDPTDSLQTYLQWIEGVVGISTNVSSYLRADWVPSPRRVSLDLAAGSHAINRVEIDFEVTAPWGRGGVVFLFVFSWTPPSQQEQMWASLWPAPLDVPFLPAGMTPSMLESFEEYNDLFAPTLCGAANSIRLLDLLPGGLSESDVGLPSAINPDVFGLSLILTRTVAAAGSEEQLEAEFYGSVGTKTQAGGSPAAAAGTENTGRGDASDFPQLELGSLGLDLRYTVDRSAGPSPSSSKTFSLDLNFSIGISARTSAPDYGLATLGGCVHYNRVDGKSSWQALAHVDQLMVGHLVSFFDSGSQDGVMDLVEHLEVETLELIYDYSGPGGSSGSHFLFDGILLLGAMQFTLKFEHWTADHDPQWSFSATLREPDATETIGSVLAYLTPDVVLPPFIADINLLGNDTGIELDVRRDKVEFDGVTTDYVVFQTNITLAGFGSVTFIQYNSKGWAGPKRVFRAALSGPLDIATIPVVEKLAQPFDTLYFLHVQDRSMSAEAPPPNHAGVLRQEFALLNANLDSGEPAFMFKETHRPQPDGKMKGTDTVIGAGLRFAVVATVHNQPTVVLDHQFGSAEPSPPTLTRPAASLAAADPGTPPATGPGDSSMAPLHKTVGPLTISNIGLQFRDGHLTILLDATFKLGPIDLALLGLGLDLDFGEPGASLLRPPSARGTIAGLGFGFVQPPVTIAGLFEARPTADGSDLFVGGVVVTFEPYLFAAAGCYGILRDGSKTVALFCLLEGPLIELEFAEITGICGGFGYNTDLRFPPVDSVASYPLIDHARIAGSPLDTTEQLLDPSTGCITARKGSVWLAAGLDADAFKLLSMKAVVAVEFSASGVGLGVFADVRASFPSPASGSPDGAGAFAYAELGIVATVDFGAGVMLAQAQLAPTSFVLAPACHLTGGFALGYWFGANQHAGDWVFTMGGYHPRYTPPPYYPGPPRLAISWSIDDSLGITGQSYFALTPKVAMGGGELQASLSLSPLYAYFDAHADFLIKFSPFYFVGEAGVDVGVRFTLDLWICTIHIDVDIGAQLYLEGPSVHGYVHVDFWVFGFDIYFGNEGPRPDPVTLKDFYYLLKQAEPAARATPEEEEGDGDGDGADTIDGAQQLSCVGGLVTSPHQDETTAQAEAWPVRAGPFQFRVTSPFASDTAAVAGGASTPGSGNPIYARPMQNANSLASTTTVTVTRLDETGAAGTVTGFRIERAISKVPASMWKQYSEDEDPLSAKNNGDGGGGNYIDSLLDGTKDTLIDHMLSVTVTAPAPYWPGPIVERLAAFSAADASSQNVTGRLLPAAPLAGASAAWNPQTPEDPDEWARVPASWAAPPIAPGVTVAAWAEAMGWAEADAAVGEAPADLVRDFEAYFMAVPQMTAASS